MQPKKIFLVLDLIDVHNEAARWKKKLTNNEPVMVKKIDNQKKVEIIESFKDKNFKASRILARTINNFFRSVRLDLLSIKKQSLKPGFSGWGSFTYKKLDGNIRDIKTDGNITDIGDKYRVWDIQNNGWRTLIKDRIQNTMKYQTIITN